MAFMWIVSLVVAQFLSVVLAARFSQVAGSGSSDVAALRMSSVERRQAWQLSNFFNASSGHEHPVALWIIGPSAVGKSHFGGSFAPKMGIPIVPGTTFPGTSLPGVDAVVVDGDVVRDVNKGYQALAFSPNPKDWPGAYPKYKSLINKEKDEMLKAAAVEMKHLMIPETCLNLDGLLSTMQDLIALGYTNHVVAIVAPRDMAMSKGYARANRTHKRYAPEEFDRSMAAIGPVIRAANGRYRVVKRIDEVQSEELGSGDCGPDSDVVLPDL